MYPNQNQILELQKTHVDAINAFGSAVFQAAEKLAQLNIATSRNLMQDGAGAAQSLLSAKDPQELASIAGTLAQPGAEKMVSYSRSAYNIASAANAELSKIFEAQLAEGNRKLAELVDLAAKSAPAGSEHAISLLKNSISAANTAFDAVTKAARQASETAESNIAAAVAVASDAVKPKSKKSA
ncbi:Phasin family protein [Burkholderiales bacterium]|nr:Phasin family protein [Burkholderiales bacterium]